MKISILFLSHNHEAFVAEALRSALRQNYSTYELIIHDDGSRDRTPKIIKEILENETPSHVKVVLTGDGKNYGLHESFNRGAQVCNGEIIVHMSGDDISSPHRLSRHVEIYENFPEVFLVVSEVNRIDENGNFMRNDSHASQDRKYAHNFEKKRGDVYAGAFILGAAASYRREVFDKFEPIKGNQCHAEDNAYWFRALMMGKIYYINDRLLEYRIHRGNYSDAGFDWNHGVTKEAKDKHILFLKKHALNLLQWEKDIDCALRCGYVSPETGQWLRKIAQKDAHRWQMYYLGLSQSNWKLWTQGFLRALKWLGIKKNISQLILRLSNSRKARYWNRRANEMKFGR